MKKSTLNAILSGVWFMLGLLTVLHPEENHFTSCLLAQFTLAVVFFIRAFEEGMSQQ